MCTARLPTLGQHGHPVAVCPPASGINPEVVVGVLPRIRHFSAPASTVQTTTTMASTKSELCCLSLKKSNSWLRRSCLKLRRSLEEGDQPLRPAQSASPAGSTMSSEAENESENCRRENFFADFEPAAIVNPLFSKTTCQTILPYNFSTSSAKPDLNSKCYMNSSGLSKSLKNRYSTSNSLSLSSSSQASTFEVSSSRTTASGSGERPETPPNFGIGNKSNITSINNHSSLPCMSLTQSSLPTTTFFSLSKLHNKNPANSEEPKKKLHCESFPHRWPSQTRPEDPGGGVGEGRPRRPSPPPPPPSPQSCSSAVKCRTMRKSYSLMQPFRSELIMLIFSLVAISVFVGPADAKRELEIYFFPLNNSE